MSYETSSLMSQRIFFQLSRNSNSFSSNILTVHAYNIRLNTELGVLIKHDTIILKQSRNKLFKKIMLFPFLLYHKRDIQLKK